MNFNPTFREMMQIAKNHYDVFGAWHTAKSALAYLLEESSIQDTFDQRHGVSTRGLVEPHEAGIADPSQLANAIRYAPIREEVLDHILRALLSERDPGQTTFVDLGCGKGRGVLIASRYSFARIVGVELSESLAQCARENVQAYLAQDKPRSPLRCAEIEIACCSAPDFVYPDSDLLVYMYRPFTGRVFSDTLESLAAFARARGRRVAIALCCPNEEFLIERHGGFAKTREHQVIIDQFSWVAYEAATAAQDSD